MYRFKLCLSYSRLDQSLSAFLKKYKTNQKNVIQVDNKLLEFDKSTQRQPKPIQPQLTIPQDDQLKQKYLLQRVKVIDLNEKDNYSHFNRAQQLALDKQVKQLGEDYKVEAEVLQLQSKGELLIDDTKLPKQFLATLDQERKKGKRMLRRFFVNGEHRYMKENIYKFRNVAEWKKYMRFKKPMLIDLKMEQFKRYPGTDQGKYPIQDKPGFTKWFRENHTQKTVRAIEYLVRKGYGKLPEAFTNKRGHKSKSKRVLAKIELEERLERLKQEVHEESNWETVAPGPALFVQETMMEQLLKRNPIKDLGLNTHIKIQTHIPEGEVQPLPEKFPLEKTELIYYLERWSFFRSFGAYELLKDCVTGKLQQQDSVPVKSGSLNTYYQTLPKHIRENPNVKNVYRGLEFANNQMTLAEKENSLNYAARLSCQFDELNQEVYDQGSSGYRPMVSRFDEERLMQDQENEHVDTAINPDVVFKYLEQRAHTPRHVAKDDVPLPDWAVDKSERVDDIPVDYYINDDGFWDDYIKAKEEKHLKDSPINGGKKYFRHI
ncbi:unnamed protein product [Paramecium pentaurelia]|uniref:Uncharacterized protein n=1 Tax=Paramecium pentaurelia TaxID=43138 RepID=A0A8S1WWD9_9CILI|nr:unnamed protein product [Paramecium pentaurelia]